MMFKTAAPFSAMEEDAVEEYLSGLVEGCPRKGDSLVVEEFANWKTDENWMNMPHLLR